MPGPPFWETEQWRSFLTWQAWLQKMDLTSISGAPRSKELAEKAERERLEDSHSLLLFHNSPDEPCALPLDSVQRIERVAPDQIEMAGNRRTIQYRGASLPLVTLSDVAQVRGIDGECDYAVIVSHIYGRDVGLLGSMPVDVIEIKAMIDQNTHRQSGIAGSTISPQSHHACRGSAGTGGYRLFPDWRAPPRQVHFLSR